MKTILTIGGSNANKVVNSDKKLVGCYASLHILANNFLPVTTALYSKGKPVQIETQRLTLKPISKDDWELFEELHQSSDVLKYVSDPFTESEIRERFNSRLGEWKKTSNQWLTLTIIEQATGKKIGVTGFYPEWEPYQQAELGFLLHPKFQSKGYGKESTKAVIEYAFNQCNFHKVIATVTEGNYPSFNLLKALGFTHEGTIRDNFKLGGNWCNDLKLGLLNHEYNAI